MIPNSLALKALREFQPRPVDAWMFERADTRAMLEAQALIYPTFILPDIEKPTCICGVAHSLGVGSVMLITGVGFDRSAPIVVRQLRELCMAAYKVFGLHRLHMMVNSDDAAAKRFAEKLGFVCEAARLKRMDARGQDMDIYLLERDQTWVE